MPKLAFDRLMPHTALTSGHPLSLATQLTAIMIYDTYGYGGWITVGGTSLATAVVSGVFGSNGEASSGAPAAGLYASGASLARRLRRRNSAGGCEERLPLRREGEDYDGPSGVGTPNGDSAF